MSTSVNTTALEITNLYCALSGGKVGEDNTTHHLVPKAVGGGLQIHTCRHCGRTTVEIRRAVERDGLECGGRPGDLLHHVDGAHRASALANRGRDLELFERARLAHFA